MDIYTTKDDQNIQKRCSSNGYGQLRNENLHTPLNLRNSPTDLQHARWILVIDLVTHIVMEKQQYRITYQGNMDSPLDLFVNKLQEGH